MGRNKIKEIRREWILKGTEQQPVSEMKKKRDV
jgi:hypothetical protein